MSEHGHLKVALERYSMRSTKKEIFRRSVANQISLQESRSELYLRCQRLEYETHDAKTDLEEGRRKMIRLEESLKAQDKMNDKYLRRKESFGKDISEYSELIIDKLITALAGKGK